MSSVPFRLGGAVYPLPRSQENSLLRDADPAIYFLLHFFEWAITEYIGDRWRVQVAAINRIDKAPRPVMYKTPIDPAPYLEEAQYKFPLLAVYRPHSEGSDHSIPVRSDTSDIRVDYVLPPMTAGEAEQMHPFLRAVTAILHKLSDSTEDENYTPPDDTALIGWLTEKASAGVDKVEFMSADYGLFEGPKNAFHAVSMRFIVQERVLDETDDSDLEDFEGVDGTINNVASDLDAGARENEIAVTEMKADVDPD